MKLQLSQLQEGDNRFAYQSGKSDELRAFVERMSQKGFRFTSPFETELHLTKLEPDYYLKGQMRFSLEQMCSRCAETFVLPVSHPFELGIVHIQGEEQARSPKLAEESEELDLNFFSGNELDLAPILEEQFYLGLPYQVLCRPDCRGICQQCGKNLNEDSCSCRAPEAENPFEALKKLKV